jgi:DNA-binding response OmpR family regulator
MYNEKTSSPNENESPNHKILLADDDASLRRFLEVVLQRAGFAVVSAEDGLAAMQIGMNESFDAVVADAVMPNLTGYDLCRILRQNSNYEKIPLVILSGMETAPAETENCIADAYLMKSENLKEQLVETLAQLLKSKAETEA